MDYNDVTIMSMAKNHMRYQTQRQKVLSENIANIDTPAYKAKDLKPLDFGKIAEAESKRLEMRATSPKHMEGVHAFGGPFREEKLRETYETTPTKNNVVLDEQMANVNTTQAQFQLSSSLYRKMNAMFRSAIGNR
ncbi:MAG: flagellar basal body rod protein FlgB [Alphaproteobacteria bacterium]|nr:flagellar basal body rod protein FlgB [Alphaproteobacteria bacterium]